MTWDGMWEQHCDLADDGDERRFASKEETGCIQCTDRRWERVGDDHGQ